MHQNPPCPANVASWEPPGFPIGYASGALGGSCWCLCMLRSHTPHTYATCLPSTAMYRGADRWSAMSEASGTVDFQEENQFISRQVGVLPHLLLLIEFPSLVTARWELGAIPLSQPSLSG